MDQLIELYSNKDPKKLNRRNMNRMAQKGADALAELAQTEREAYGLPIQGSWCNLCRECANMQAMHRKHCYGTGYRKICYIPGCGGDTIPEKEHADLLTPNYKTTLIGFAKVTGWFDKKKRGFFRLLGIAD